MAKVLSLEKSTTPCLPSPATRKNQRCIKWISLLEVTLTRSAPTRWPSHPSPYVNTYKPIHRLLRGRPVGSRAECSRIHPGGDPTIPLTQTRPIRSSPVLPFNSTSSPAPNYSFAMISSFSLVSTRPIDRFV